MTDTETSEASPPEGTDHERIERVEGKLDTLIDTFNRFVSGTHEEASEQTEERLDRPSGMEEAARAEVQRALKAQHEQEERERADTEHKAQHAALATMGEKPPAAPRLRRTPWLGWGDGRG